MGAACRSRPMSVDVLKLVDGSPVLSKGGYVPLVEAANLSGISQNQLLWAAANGTLKLFCRISPVPGHALPFDELDPVNPEAGRSGGVVVPQPQFMPSCATEVTRGGVLPVYDSSDVASGVLAECLEDATVLLLFAPGEEAQVDYGEGAPTRVVGSERYRKPRLSKCNQIRIWQHNPHRKSLFWKGFIGD